MKDRTKERTKTKEEERKQIHKIVVGALRETIRVHGKINPLLIGSAAKRITGMIMAKKRKSQNNEV